MTERIVSKFGMRSTAAEVIEGIDLHGKTAIVTGATSGLGIETARTLAAAGAEIFIPARNHEKGEAIAADLRAATGNDEIHVSELDLSDFGSIRRFTGRFLESGKPVHILVNNAAIMACPLARTPEGFESQFATNHLGHFLLTGRLAPALIAGKARVVSLSSIGHRLSPVLFDDIHFETREYDKWRAYGQAKTANALFAVGLNIRLAPHGGSANAVHPGGIMTGLQQHLTTGEMTAMGWIDTEGKLNPLFKTIEQGAATSVWAAVGPELDGCGGLYLEDCNQAEPAVPEKPYSGVHAHASDPEAAARLWTESETMVGETFSFA